jgi:hypothetical protein
VKIGEMKQNKCFLKANRAEILEKSEEELVQILAGLSIDKRED